MVDLSAMIMINLKLRLLFITSFFFLASCETLSDLAGLTKPDLENDIVEQTPDLVLPPDFNRVASPTFKRPTQSRVNSRELNNSFNSQYQSVQPQIKNFLAPQIIIESSRTPSDSIERFKENKKFTIGEWVYGQYVQGFKEGNLYYRPIYDKGYNFSRRYLPDQNVSSFLNGPEDSIQKSDQIQTFENNFDPTELDNLPIID